MAEQPIGSTQQTKKAFKESLAKNVAQKPVGTAPTAWGTLANNPTQVANVWAQAKTISGQPASASPGTATPKKGLTTVTLSHPQYQTYQQWTEWAAKYKVDVPAIFSGSPDFATFTGFMGKLKGIRESPGLGATEQTMAKEVAQEVSGYLAKHGVSGATASWGGDASTATLPAKEKKPAPSEEGGALDQAPWVTQKFTWTCASDIFKHKSHLVTDKDKQDYLGSVEELVEYVETNADEFRPKGGAIWQLVIGGLKTKSKGDQQEKYWSIVAEVTGPGQGRIFHYGPEHLYK
jgi:hypothetical protein